MRENNMTRKIIYSLLFSRPLFEYAVTVNNQKHIDVLIIGDNDTVLEAFKAVYWCCQMSDDYYTSITLASSSSVGLKKKLYDKMPALKDSLVSTNTQFIEYDSIDKSLIDKNKYVFLSDDIDQGQNAFISLFEETCDPHTKRLLCVFGSGLQSRKNNNTEIINMSDDSVFEEEFVKLERYAYNSDFAYAMGENERCKKKKYSEFVNVNEYAYLSSLSFPVHIPYKLRVCEEHNESNNISAIETLKESIEQRNSLYYQLLDIEHRRWMAYMVTEGWRMPTDEELSQYAYNNYGFGGNDQREKVKKLHPCMCKGSSKGCILLKHNGLWESTSRKGISTLQEMKEFLDLYYPEEEFSDLEAISLVLHSLANKKAYQVNEGIDTMFDFADCLSNKENLTIYNHLRQSAHKLIRREENAISLFENTLKQAQAAALEDGCYDKIEYIKRSMQIVIERNRKKNFFMIDSVMIDMIPFCLWYGVDNRTVVTFSSILPTDDVIVPTMLCAEKAIFIAPFITEKYKQSIIEYFEKRNHNTESIFIICDTENQEAVFDIMDNVCNEYDGVVLNCVNHSESTVVMTIGAVAEIKKLPVFIYSNACGLINITNGKKADSLLNKKSFTVDEYVNLMGGEYSNLYDSTPYYRELDQLESMFVKYSYEQDYSKGGKKKIYSTWSALSNFFRTASKNKTYNIAAKYGKQCYKGIFEKDVFDNCRIESFLTNLQTYRIISGYKKKSINKEHKDRLIIEFTYYDSRLNNLISQYDCQHTFDLVDRRKTLQKRLGFSLSQEAIEVQDLHVEKAQLCNSDEQTRIKELKVGFIKELKEKGMIHSVSFSNDKDYVTLTFDNFSILSLFKNQGKLFELILYYKLKNCGYFSDVQTGVKISWSSKNLTLEDLVADIIERSGTYGYNNYLESFKKARNDFFYTQYNIGTANEIDIVLTNGMIPTFISCKTSKSVGNGELYEIASIAEHFHAKPVLAVTKDLERESSNLLLLRAKQMGVSLIGFETIFDTDRFIYAIKQLAQGENVFGTETFAKN